MISYSMPLELAIYVLIGILLFGLLTAKILRDQAKARKGVLQVQLDQKLWHLGQPVSGTLVLKASANIELLAINVRLRGEARRSVGSGKERRVHEKKLYERTETYTRVLSLTAGETCKQPFSLPMPSIGLNADDEKRMRKPFGEDRMEFILFGDIDCVGVDLDVVEPLVTVRTRSY